VNKPNDSAFPEIRSKEVIYGHSDLPPVMGVYSQGGLTKRELIAAIAMNGILQNSVNHEKEVRFSETSVAKGAVEYADALLLELSKGAE
jgi:hypothetical protein